MGYLRSVGGRSLGEADGEGDGNSTSSSSAGSSNCFPIVAGCEVSLVVDSVGW